MNTKWVFSSLLLSQEPNILWFDFIYILAVLTTSFCYCCMCNMNSFKVIQKHSTNIYFCSNFISSTSCKITETVWFTEIKFVLQSATLSLAESFYFFIVSKSFGQSLLVDMLLMTLLMWWYFPLSVLSKL